MRVRFPDDAFEARPEARQDPRDRSLADTVRPGDQTMLTRLDLHLQVLDELLAAALETRSGRDDRDVFELDADDL